MTALAGAGLALGAIGAALSGGAAHGQLGGPGGPFDPFVPFFDGGTTYTMPLFERPRAIAATPPGLDLLGAGGSAAQDGFPEVAVASWQTGFIRVYRNEFPTPGTTAATALTPVPVLPWNGDIDVYGEIDSSLATDSGAFIRDMQFGDLDGDGRSDLVVAVEFKDVGQFPGAAGAVIVFRAIIEPNDDLRFRMDDFVLLENPPKDLALADVMQNGRQHILAATARDAVNPPQQGEPDPTRVFVIENQASGPAIDLVRLGDAAIDPMTPRPGCGAGNCDSAAIVAGQFNGTCFGEEGGGGSGTGGCYPDFLTFLGDGSGDVQVGVGLLPGYYAVNDEPGTACGGAGAVGFGAGIVTATGDADPLVLFDPFANPHQSLATSTQGTVALLHNNKQVGAFYQLCDAMGLTTDVYDVVPCGTVGAANAGFSDVAGGNLNGDLYDDLVHIDGESQRLALLLGRGKPQGGNRIMKFERCEDDYFIHEYPGPGSASNSPADRAIIADLNMDNRGDILITRNPPYGTSTYGFRLFMNLGNLPPE